MLYDSGNSNRSSVTTQKGWGRGGEGGGRWIEREMGRRFKREGTRV